MFSQSVEVLKAPNVYKAHTPYGTFVCKRTTAPIGRLQVIGGILRNLQLRGWNGAVPILYTKYGEPYVARGKSIYYLTAWTSPQEETNVQNSWEKTIVRLAELHHFTQNYRFADPRQIEPLVESLSARWKSWTEQFEQAVETAARRTYPSPFDVVLLANQAFLLDSANQAINSLESWKQRNTSDAHFRLSVIHGSPHPAHTVTARDGQVQLINFDRAGFDTPVRDVSIFYRAFFQSGGELEAASRLYERYCTVFPLRPDESRLLSIFLSFPERLMRTVEAYYNRTGALPELAAVKRLEKDMDRYLRVYRWIGEAF